MNNLLNNTLPQITFILFQICPNGLICFKQPFSGYVPPRNSRGYSADFKGAVCIAPYFADLIVTHNQLFYQSYDFSTVSNANVNVKVKGFVNESYGEANFEPIYVLKATWNAAAKKGGNGVS